MTYQERERARQEAFEESLEHSEDGLLRALEALFDDPDEEDEDEDDSEFDEDDE